MSSEERRKVQEFCIPFFETCQKDALAGCCTVCGEPNKYCIDRHHPDVEKQPSWTIPLCANCHRIFDRNLNGESALEQLKGRRAWLFELNRSLGEEKLNHS